jgi:phosphoribosylaminoimidazole (AIR) synthetase
VGKFAEDILFPRGLSADLGDLFDPPQIMKNVAEWRGMSDVECYRTFNCGNGMLVAIDEEDIPVTLKRAELFRLRAKVVGRITRNNTPSLLIRSGFSGRKLEYSSRD